MPLQFSPAVGTIVICNYDTGFRAPEMVKQRLAVVVSPRLPHRDGLCTVVPLSMTPPRAGIRYQCKIHIPIDPPSPFSGQWKWAKADMLATVCYDRLNLPFRGKGPTGKRVYEKIIMPLEEIAKIRAAIREALAL